MHNRLLDQPLAAAEPLSPASGPSLWEILWHRKAYVALGAVAGLVLGVLYWSMAPKTYESAAQVWVLKKQPNAPLSAPNSSSAAVVEANAHAGEDFLGTHQSVLRSSVILNDAMTRGQLSERETFRTTKQPTRSLARALTVGRDRDKTLVSSPTSQVLNVAFRCDHAEDCVPVLSAVLDSYRDYLDNRSQNTAQKTLDLIVKARDLLQNDLEAKEKARDEFLLNTPVLWKTQYGTTLHQERLGHIDTQRATLEVRRVQLKATLAAVDEALAQGRPRGDLLEILSAMPANTVVRRTAKRDLRSLMQRGMPEAPMMEPSEGMALSGSLEQEMVHLQLEEGRLLATYGGKHPQVQALRDRLQTVRVLLAPTTTPQASTEEGRQRDSQAKEKLVDLRLAQLKQEVSEAERGLASLESLFQNEMQEAKKAFPYETQESSLRRTIARSQVLYDNINQRLKELNVVRDTGGFDTQVITPPTEAEKVSPRGSLVLPMGLLLGLLLGCGLAYLAELTDKSFRSPEDVRRRLGLPVMGVIPRIKGIGKSSRSDNGAGLLDGSLCTWHRPSSSEAEAYRGVRTALYFSTRGQGRKIIQITSPSHSEGKSTLSSNLAVCIAQSGKRVLLVDGDLRRPRVASLFGVSSSVGVSSVLSGAVELPEAIVETTVGGLSVLCSGPLPPNPSELLTSGRLRESLSWLRDHYDYVLIDSPPLLAVTDPGVLASQMDGVIVTLRWSKKGRVEAVRAKEVLDNLGVPIFGIVLNAVDPNQGAASYGYAGYGYHENDTAANGEGRRVHTADEGNGTSASGA